MTPKEIKVIYESFWKFVRSKIEEIPFKAMKSEEDFQQCRTSFNIPRLGKFYSTWVKVKHINDNYVKNGGTKNKKYKTHF